MSFALKTRKKPNASGKMDGKPGTRFDDSVPSPQQEPSVNDLAPQKKPRPILQLSQNSNPSDQDRGVIPPAERFSAVMDVAGSAGNTTPATTKARRPLILSSPDPNADDLQATVDEGVRLRTAPITRENGRVKSALIGALVKGGEAARQALASGSRHPLLETAGGAAGGFAGGAINDKWDEEAERQRAIAKNDEKTGFLVKARKDVAGIKSVEAVTKLKEIEAANGGRNAGQKARDAERQRGALERHLVKFYPDGYQIGTDSDVDAELERLQMKPPPPLPKKPSGPGRAFTYTPGQLIVRPDGAGSFQYYEPHGDDGEPAPDMTPAQKKDLELRGDYNQITRDRNNQFAGRIARRVMSRSSGSKGDSIGESLEARDAARYSGDAATARAKAAELRSRGDDEAAQAWNEAARVADSNASKVGDRRRRGSMPAPKKGDPLGILD